MPRNSYDVVIDVEPGRQAVDAAIDPEAPFQILILADLSGRVSRGVLEPVLGRRPVFVDRDEIETLPKVLGTEIRLPLDEAGDAEVRLKVDHLDDLHPDHIFSTCELFPALRAMRKRLESPEALKKATDEILGGLARETAPEAQAPTSIITGSLLDQIADQSEASAAAPAARRVKPADPLLAYIHDLVKPHLVPGEDPVQKELLAEMDAQVGVEMRKILHHPLFQNVEAAWRSLDKLVREVETDTQLKIYVLDVSKAELLADLATAADLRRTGLFQILSASPANGEPWALLGCDCYFRPWIDDVELLGRLAMLADYAGVPLLAGADASVLGVKDPARLGEMEEWQTGNPVWDEARTMPEARRVGLTMPRILVRMPYGRNDSPIERFAFEEMEGGSTHEHYLWGNAMYGAVTLIGQAFSQNKWNFRPGQLQTISRLPMHTWKEDGNVELKPCGEVLLTLEAAEKMIELGLMPVLTMKGTDQVRIGMFQSIAKPPTPLQGRWNQ
jgi:type VI secretion system protein ImpC